MLGRRPIKRVLLKDLEEPFVGIVSFVQNPAVPKARFFALKSTDDQAASDALTAPAGIRDQIAGLPTTADGAALRAAVLNRR